MGLVRLTSPARRALAGGLAFGAIATGIAFGDNTRHGVGIAVVLLIVVVLCVGVVQFGSRGSKRT